LTEARRPAVASAPVPTRRSVWENGTFAEGAVGEESLPPQPVPVRRAALRNRAHAAPDRMWETIRSAYFHFELVIRDL
jgi:hypothetical protein